MCARHTSQAIELLAQTQECSKYFRDFDFQQLLDLVHELTILYFKEGETVLFQGEPASFFGVVLKGALTPVVGDESVGASRGVGTSPATQKSSKWSTTSVDPSFVGLMAPLAETHARSGPSATCTCEMISPRGVNS